MFSTSNSVAVPLKLYPEYGYVLLVICSTLVLHIWQMLQVGKMRKKLKIFYPTMYSDKHPDFNCFQRAHQNTLENVPFLLATLPFAGIRHPCVAAAFGAMWIVARVFYSLGYYTGDPRKRMPGVMASYAAQWGVIFCVVSTAAGMIGWW